MILRSVTLAKEIGLIIKFDDVEYSDEERNRLWGQMLLCMCEMAHKQGENYGKEKDKKRVAC